MTSYEYINDTEKYYKSKGKVLCVKLIIGLSYSGMKAENVQIQLNLPKNLECPEQNMPHIVEEIRGNKYSFETPVYVIKGFTPSSFIGEVLVTYYDCVAGSNFCFVLIRI